MAERRRVVVTGLGALTPLGLTVADSWQAILAGQSGIRPVTQFDASEYASQISGSVQNFDPSLYMPAKDTRKIDTFVQYGVASAKQAWEDAGLELDKLQPKRVGVAVGSGIGGIPMIEKNHDALLAGGPRKISPFFIPGAIINMVSGYISILLGLQGPNVSLVTACTTGTHGIGFAARMIQHGDADVMLAGGAEMATCPLGIGGFSALRALSTRNHEPELASRPWDKDRDGFVLGDGAGVLVLEEYEHAKARGAQIYAELTGFGMSADAYHMTSPPENGEGAYDAMVNTLQDAQLDADKVDYINAHGTSTPVGDEIEARAMERLFTNSLDSLAVSSTKSMTGHLLGAAGAIEAVFTVLALRDQVAPPTINLDNPPEACRINLVPHQAQERTIRYAMSNSFGFGGTNASLLFSQV